MRRTLVQWALAHALREERTKRGMTHAAAARTVGVAQRTYTSWESAEKRPGDQHLDAIAKFLDRSKATVVMLLHGLPAVNGDSEGNAERLAVIEQAMRDLTTAVTRLTEQMDTFEHGPRSAPAGRARRR